MSIEQRAKDIADRILAHCNQVLTKRSVTTQQARNIADDLISQVTSIERGLEETRKRMSGGSRRNPTPPLQIDMHAPSMMIDLPPYFSDAIPPLEVLRTIIERQLVQELKSGSYG